MKEGPLVSVCMPCHNAERYVGEAIESVLNQTYKNIELIVVNDGSTDRSGEILENYKARGVKVLTEKCGNASRARNRAVAESHGSYFQYLDADDVLEKQKIEQQMGVLAENTGYLAFGRWGRFDHTIQDVKFSNDDQLREWSPVEWLSLHCERHQMMHPAAWLISRDLIERVGPWNENLTLNDDGEYFARVVALSKGLKCVPEAISFYRTNWNPSLSKIRGRKAFQSHFESLVGTAAALLGLEKSLGTQKAAADMFQRFIFEIYPSAPDLRAKARERVKELGGSLLQPELGPRSRLLRALLGWQVAVVLARMARKRRPV
jgi:glycosyltransferase involved in cell wall biosynthesis